MNAEIKFRGKSDRPGSCRWLYGIPLTYGDRAIIIDDPAVYLSEEYISISVDIKSISQFTGLKDKNRDEAYYNDVVRFTQAVRVESLQSLVSVTFTGVITRNKYMHPCIMVGCREFHIDNLQRGEIIGNTFDDPELINDKI